MGTITKALNLLNYFSEQSPELGLADFVRLSGHDKATIYRHLTALEKNGFLEQNPMSKKYRLGASIMRLSMVRERTFPVRRIVAGRVDELAAFCLELVHASLLQSSGMSPLHYCDGGVGGTRVYFNPADILPFHATASGLVGLAFGDPAMTECLLDDPLERFTDHTPNTRAALQAAIKDARQNGFVFTNQSYEAEVSSFAVPFYQNTPYAAGAISIAIPTSRIAGIDQGAFLARLWATAEGITQDLGGEIPAHLNHIWKRAA